MATPILIGGGLYVALRDLLMPDPFTISLLAIATIAALRVGAIRWGWAFPDWLTYRPLK